MSMSDQCKSSDLKIIEIIAESGCDIYVLNKQR